MNYIDHEHPLPGIGTNGSYLVDPRAKGQRALGLVTNGADGSQGTVLDVNTTAGVK